MRITPHSSRSVWPILAALVLSAPAVAQPSGSTSAETPEQFAARTAWWKDAKFGMFIHWGVYSVPAEAIGGYPAEWYYYAFNDYRMKHPDLLKTSPYLQVKDYE